MRITESAAYIKGLVDGLELDATTKEGKVILKLIDVIEEMAVRINDLEDANEEIYDCLDAINEDVDSIIEDIYDEDEAEYDDLDDLLDDEDVPLDDEDYYEVECPSCGETICFAESVNINELACPVCGELVGDIEFIDDEEESTEE